MQSKNYDTENDDNYIKHYKYKLFIKKAFKLL